MTTSCIILATNTKPISVGMSKLGDIDAPDAVGGAQGPGPSPAG